MRDLGTQFDVYRLLSSSWTQQYPWRRRASHTHLDVEIVFAESGAMTLDFAGHAERMEAGDIVVYWGGLPHAITDVAIGTTVHGTQFPIATVLPWIASPALDGLLRGSVVRSRATRRDADLFAQWTSDFANPHGALRSAAELEMQGRLLRLLEGSPLSSASLRPAVTSMLADAIHYLTLHFTEDITIDDVAATIGRSRSHLMTSFREVCGITVWDYVTRLRLGHAQHLLASTDLPVLAVCQRAGFASTSRMYDAFHRYCHVTPAAYRARLTSTPPG